MKLNETFTDVMTFIEDISKSGFDLEALDIPIQVFRPSRFGDAAKDDGFNIRYLKWPYESFYSQITNKYNQSTCPATTDNVKFLISRLVENSITAAEYVAIDQLNDIILVMNIDKTAFYSIERDKFTYMFLPIEVPTDGNASSDIYGIFVYCGDTDKWLCFGHIKKTMIQEVNEHIQAQLAIHDKVVTFIEYASDHK